MNEEEKQVEEPEGEPQQEPEGEPAEASEKIKQLLTEEPEGEPKEEVKEEVKEPKGEPVPLIPDDLIEKFSTLKMYRGKPITELIPAYDGMVRKLNQVINEKKELEKKLDQDGLKSIGDPPDPIDDPKGFDKWLQRRDEIIRSQTKPEVVEPQINPLQIIQQKLPEGVDANKVADEWAKFNSDTLFDELGGLRPEFQTLYKQKPELLVSQIVNYYNLMNKAEQNEVLIQSKAKEQAYGQVKQSFKDAKRTKSETLQSNAAQRQTELTPEDEILSNIFNSIPKEG